MKPYVIGIIGPGDVERWTEISAAVHKLPDDIILGKDDIGEDIVISCHMLARAVGNLWKLKVVDGHFDTFFEHSWCKTSDDNIIDVYPVGILGGPILVDGHTHLARTAYSDREVSKTTKRQFESEWFTLAVQIIVKCIRIYKHNTALA